MTESVPLHGYCHDRFSKVRDVFAENLRQGTDLGASVAFVRDGEVVVDLWGGYIDEERTREWERDTLVNLYSTTKGMTALCAHQLIEQGRIDVEAPVAEYWPEFAAGGKERVLVRHLLTHEAGLPAVRTLLPPEAIFDWQTMVDALAATEPWWEPGSRHGYHALTFGHLVGEVVRRASRKSIGRYFREHVAEPLEIDFHIGLPEADDARTSPLYGRIGGAAAAASEGLPAAMRDFLRDMGDPSTMTGAAFNNPPGDASRVNTRAWRGAEIPAANGHGTALALARVYGALARGGEVDGVRVLESESIDRAIEERVYGPDAVLGGLPMRFGLGFMLRQPIMPFSPSQRAFGHPGAGGSIGMADPDARVGFGYTLNKMQMGLVGGAGGFAMLRAFFEAL